MIEIEKAFPFVMGTFLGSIFGATGSWILWGATGLGWSFLCIAVVVVGLSFGAGAEALGDGEVDLEPIFPPPRPGRHPRREKPDLVTIKKEGDVG